MKESRITEERSVTALTAIRRIVRASDLASRSVSDRTGLTPSQIFVLQIIANAGQPGAGAGAVADSAHLSQATVTAILDRLEEHELVLRTRGRDDRRRVTAALTEKGRTTLAAAPDVLRDKFVSRFNRLADWEQSGLIAALERVVALLDAQDVEGAPVLGAGQPDRSPSTGNSSRCRERC